MNSINPFEPTTTTTTVTNTVATMSSREIAELTSKNHADVMRDIKSQLGQLGDLSKFAEIYLDSMNREQPCYNLPRRECEILVTGYDVVRRAKVIDRWMELETGKNIPSTGNPLLDALVQTQLQQQELQCKVEGIESRVNVLGSKVDNMKTTDVVPNNMKTRNQIAAMSDYTLSSTKMKEVFRRYLPCKHYHIDTDYGIQAIEHYNVQDGLSLLNQIGTEAEKVSDHYWIHELVAGKFKLKIN